MVENLILPGIPKIYFLLGVKVASRKAYRIRDHLALLYWLLVLGAGNNGHYFPARDYNEHY